MLDHIPPQPSFPDWPVFGLFEDTMKFVLKTCDANRPVALATLIEATGGSPRPPGTQMAITSEGMSGYLSGGCIEADVALHARQTLIHGLPKILVYGDKGQFRDIRLQCGATITIAIEKLLPSDLAIKTYAALRKDRQQIIWISDGERRYTGSRMSDFQATQRKVAAIALSSKAGAGRYGDAYHWVRHLPPVRLILVGSDPTTLAIARLAKDAEFETILVRRSGPAEPPPSEVHVYARTTPEQVLADLVIDDRTAIIFADHDFEANKHLVLGLLRSEIGYVGMLGAARQRPAKDSFLRQNGIRDADIARFRSPAGFPLGKSTPAAIAISIIAEIISVMSDA